LYQRSGLQRVARATGLVRVLPRFVQVMEAIAPPLHPREALAAFNPAQGQQRGTVALLTGCVQGSFFPEVNAATVRVLCAEGFDVVVPTDQGCCGALSGHAGRKDEARRFARSVIDLFERSGVDTVIVNSAGCGSAMKEYGHLLSGDNRYAERAERFASTTRDVIEFLDEQGTVAARHPLDLTVAYHDACHLGHAQRVTRAPRSILGAIPGLVVRDVPEAEICCGSAGIYNILQPDAAAELGARKAANVAATGAELVVAANPGCTMQIATASRRIAHPVKMAHTIELVDASIRGRSRAEVLDSLD
jgi:glycolate oxidase iron-sulfur subunit